MITLPSRPTPRYAVVEAAEGVTAMDVHALLGSPGPAPPASQPLHGYAVGAPVPDHPSPLPRLVVADGPDAGACVPLSPGTWVSVGRDPSCDLRILDRSLSRRHVRVRLDRDGVVVDDLGSTNGLRWSPLQDGGGGTDRWPPGHDLLVGCSRLRLLTRTGAPLAVRGRRGRSLVRPWPRTVPARPRTDLSTPPAPEPPDVRPPSAWAWGLPLGASVALAVVLRMPFLLLFGLMAPAMMLGHHLGERRRARTEHRAATARHHEDLLTVLQEQRRAVATDLAALRSRHPGLGGAVAALLPLASTDLWSRAAEPVEVVVGRCRSPSSVRLDGRAGSHDEAPVVLDLGQPLTVVGPAPLRDGLVRSLLLQATTSHPPSAVAVLVDADAPPAGTWDLLAWLPHTRPVRQEGPLELRWGEHVSMVDDVRDAPVGRARVEVHDAAHAVLRRPGEPDVAFVPTLLGLPRARHLARVLGGYEEDLPGEVPGPGPGGSALGDLTPWPTGTAAVRRRWADAGALPGLSVPVGTDDQGRSVTVDLVRDGPHALVAGTTGAGKSELLRTLVAGLALTCPPSRLGVLLLDYKGGSSLGQLARLPHAVGLVTDLDPYLARRVLVSLQAELRRRERVLAEAGQREVVGADGPVPRLLVVVDEFRVLAEEMPDFLGGLVRVATVGRSLGVHLVLATQRPAGAVTPDLRANVNLRVALRVRDVPDSLDVLEVPDAAHLPEDRPGAALMRTGSGPPRAFQAVRVGPPRRADHAAGPGTLLPASTGPVVREVPDVWAGWRAVTGVDGAGRAGRVRHPSPPDPVEDLVALVRRAAEEAPAGGAPVGRARAVWRPPLPDRLDAPAPGTWALADRPEQQSREALTWAGADHIALVGAPRSGRTTAARALLAAAGPVWLYVVDPARDLEGTEVSRHPGLRAWVGPDDSAHGAAVLRALCRTVDRRRAQPDPDRSPVVVLVDGWDRWTQEQEDGGHDTRDLTQRLLRDGPAVGVSVVLTGDRQLVAGTVARHVPETWLLPTHDPTDVVAAGLRQAQVPGVRPAGRAVRTRDGLVAQVHLPCAGGEHVDPPRGDPPPRLAPLPRHLPPDGPWAVGGDEAGPVPLPTGSALVLGPPGSGVTHTLATLAGTAVPGGAVRRDDDGDGAGDSPDAGVLWVPGPGVWDEHDLSVALEGPVATVVLDETHLLVGSRTEELVLAWAERTGGRLLVGGELTACASSFRGAVPFVGRRRTGLVLQPSRAGHGAPLAVDLPTGDVRVPGRGVLVVRGRCTRVQVRAPGGPPDAP